MYYEYTAEHVISPTQKEHLNVSYMRLFRRRTQVRRRLDTRRHMYGHLLNRTRPIAVQSAGMVQAGRAIMAAMMSLSNIAMVYVRIDCGEWRRLVAPCSLQKQTKIEP